MERGALNGVPIWVRLVDLTGGERNVVHQAPGVDGARIERQGQLPGRYSIEFSLINDGEWITQDAEAATLELRTMLLSGGPFTLSVPGFDELTDLDLDGPWNISWFDDQRLVIKEGALTLIEARSFPILSADATADVQAAVQALSLAAGNDFIWRLPDIGPSQGALDVLNAATQWLADTQAQIAAAFEPVNEYASAVQALATQTEQLLAEPGAFLQLLQVTVAQILGLIPALAAQEETDQGSAAIADRSTDKPAAQLVQALDSVADFDSGVPTPQGEFLGENASEEDLEELDEMNSARSLTLVAALSGVSLAVSDTNFATVQGVLDVADALLAPVAKLFELDGLDYRVYAQARQLWKSTLRVLADQSADLPSLRAYTTRRPTDVFDLLMVLYTDEELADTDAVQGGADQLAALNQLPDPMDIAAGTTLNYLSPLS